MSSHRPADARRAPLALLVLAALAAAGLWFVHDRYLVLVATQVLVWATLGLAWNIVGGYAGQLSFGHAAFFGIGAFGVALTYAHWQLTPWLGIPLVAVLGALAALVVGAITFRLRGHYFSLAMLAYPMALLYVFEWGGFQEVSLPMRRDDGWVAMQFDDPRWLGLVALALAVFTAYVSIAIERSAFGLRLAAIKEDESAARAAGVAVFRSKLAAMVASGAFAAAAGGLYAVVLLLVTPAAVFGMFTSAQALIVCLFGGVGTVWGPLIGAVVLMPTSEFLTAQFGATLPGIQGVLYGVAIIAIVLVAPEGIYWRVVDALGRSRRPMPAREAPPAVVAIPVRPRRADGPTKQASLMQVRGLSRAFGGVAAVEGFDIDVLPGTVHGLIGPNGAGKTTAFNLINGFVRPQAGVVTFDGADVTGRTPEDLCRRGIGRTFQTVRAFRRLSVRQNVMVAALTTAPRLAAAHALADAALEVVGLSPAEADVAAGSLTSLQLRLMELARALAGRPKLLMLDETLAGLGRDDLPAIVGAIRRIADTGVTVLIIEHTMHVLANITDTLTVLDHGRVIAQGRPTEVLDDPRVIESYLGKKWADRALRQVA